LRNVLTWRREVVLLHHEPGPDEVHQGVLADQLAAPLHQGEQQVEGAAAERRRHAVDEEALLLRLQLEAAEAQAAPNGRRRGIELMAPPRGRVFRRLEKAFRAPS
jgi:hypothetical protein